MNEFSTSTSNTIKIISTNVISAKNHIQNCKYLVFNFFIKIWRFSRKKKKLLREIMNVCIKVTSLDKIEFIKMLKIFAFMKQ